MSKAPTASPGEIEELDRSYLPGGLRATASPHVHSDDPHRPHAGRFQRTKWIDFERELTARGRGTSGPAVHGSGLHSRREPCRAYPACTVPMSQWLARR